VEGGFNYLILRVCRLDDLITLIIYYNKHRLGRRTTRENPQEFEEIDEGLITMDNLTNKTLKKFNSAYIV
jgi:hypothetical protein